MVEGYLQVIKGGHMNFELIKTMGIITYCCLWITAFAGLGLWKLHFTKIRPWMHFLLAVITLLFATTHLTLILLLTD